MPEEIRFGQLVKDRRLEMGLTQSEFANRVGCAVITLRRIEAGTLRPSYQMAERFALALNIPEEDQLGFIRLSRQMKPSPPIPKPTPTPNEIGLSDLSGRAVNGFQLGELIGSGGFGVVYKAIQPSVKREVAVKIILPKFANQPEFIRRFESEAQLVARLEHPHIVPLYDYWREPDAAYLIMRLLKGGNLEERIQQGGSSLETSLRMMQQVGLALEVAHRQGVIHRDIKPANVMLDEMENAYLTDFGIAKIVGVERGPTNQDGPVVGSPAYISPEQILAEPVQPQSDIYGFGILLFEMITGEKPFKGPTQVAYLQQHLQERLPSLLDYVPDVPLPLDRVIQKATTKKPEERYQTMLDLLHDLEGVVIAGKQIVAWPAAEEPIQPSTQEIAALENPFLGLRPFTEADADNFYGRNTLVQELLGLMADGTDLARFVAVVGPSGSGKSSVVKAGLIPALRRGGLPESENWYLTHFAPSHNPWSELAAALLRVAADPSDNLDQLLQADERGLLRAVRQLLPDDGESELLLVVDQFEELFTLVADEPTRASFLNSLVTAVLEPDSRLRVIITLRADFTGRPLQYTDFGELMRERMIFVLPLLVSELTEAITQPIIRLGLEMEPALVSAIVKDAADQPGVLPLLQYTLTELFEQRNGRILTLAHYQAMGGLTGALARRADEIFAQLDSAAQTATRQLFLRLVTLGEGIEDTRRRVLLSELESLSVIGDQLSVIGDRFTEYGLPITEYGRYRLLTFDHDPVTRGATVEVAHEALLREWPRLRDWLADSREDVRKQRELAQATAQWEASGKDMSYLLRGGRLTQFEAWLEVTHVALTINEQKFLDSSIVARDQRQNEEEARRERELETARQLIKTEKQRAQQYALAQEQATLATARELALQANSNLDIDPELSILLAQQSLARVYTAEGEVALHRAIQASRVRMTLTEHTASVVWVAVSGDGRYFASASYDDTVILWNVLTGESLFTYHQRSIDFWRGKLVFSADSTQLVILTGGPDLADKTDSDPLQIVIWDIQAAVERGETEIVRSVILPVSDTMAVTDYMINPDLSLFAVGYDDGTLELWNPVSGRLLLRFSAHSQKLSLNFSLDGSLLATMSDDTSIKVWSVASLLTAKTEPILTMLDKIIGAADTLTFSPDNSILVNSARIRLALVWKLVASEKIARGEQLYALQHNNIIRSSTFNSDSTQLVTTSMDSIIRIWDVATGELLIQLAGHQDQVHDVALTIDDQTVITAGEDKTVKVWDISSDGLSERFNRKVHHDSVSSLVIDLSGTILATASEDSSACLLDCRNGEVLQTFTGHQGWVFGISINDDGSRVATASLDGTAKVWDARSGAEIVTVDECDGFGINSLFPGILDVAFHPQNENIVATARADGLVNIHNLHSGGLISRTVLGAGRTINNIVFSADGTYLAAVAQSSSAFAIGIVVIWETIHYEPLVRLELPNMSWTMAFSPDNQLLAVGMGRGGLHIYKAMTGELLFDLKGHTALLWRLSFDRTGKRLITTAFDGTVRFWDVQTGSELFVLPLAGLPQSVAVSPDDNWLYVGTKDGRVVGMALPLENLLALAESRVTRTLTEKECQQYLHVDVCPEE